MDIYISVLKNSCDTRVCTRYPLEVFLLNRERVEPAYMYTHICTYCFQHEEIALFGLDRTLICFFPLKFNL